jgi:hypothetical protein
MLLAPVAWGGGGGGGGGGGVGRAWGRAGVERGQGGAARAARLCPSGSRWAGGAAPPP